jgi:hypothetical protein
MTIGFFILYNHQSNLTFQNLQQKHCPHQLGSSRSNFQHDAADPTAPPTVMQHSDNLQQKLHLNFKHSQPDKSRRCVRSTGTSDSLTDNIARCALDNILRALDNGLDYAEERGKESPTGDAAGIGFLGYDETISL